MISNIYISPNLKVLYNIHAKQSGNHDKKYEEGLFFFTLEEK
jgi:hypothetical protein